MIPITSLVRDRGPRLMLLVAIFWGITSTYDKVAVQNSNPFFYLGISYSIYTCLLLPFVAFKKSRIAAVVHNTKILTPLGITQGISVILQMSALPFTFAAYVVAVKHLSTVLGVLWGKILFKEEHIRERLLGAIIILVGITLIVLS